MRRYSSGSLAALGLSTLAAASCGSLAPTPGVVEVSDASFDSPYEASPPTGRCAAVEQEQTIEGRTHVAECSFVSYGTRPPSSGNHYPVWAAYETYAAPIPEGYWVHNLEHGTIVFSYNCAAPAPDDGGTPGGCAADVAAAQAMMDALPVDPECVAPVRRRSVMTPDPKLDVRFAASAWGWTLRANCFDAPVFQSFALRHYAQGPEDLCGNGEDLSTGVPPGCGDP